MIVKFISPSVWIERFKDYKSFKRPIVVVPENFNTELSIGKQFPVPWQSVPVFGPKGAVFNIIENNEEKTFTDNLCGYCGIQININENVVRWTNMDSKPSHKGVRVFSDHLPMHKKCMKKARVFCPYMRKRLDEEFEYGKFNILKNNMITDLQKFNK